VLRKALRHKGHSSPTGLGIRCLEGKRGGLVGQGSGFAAPQITDFTDFTYFIGRSSLPTRATIWR
jgi:hypothetical protein